MIGVNDNNVFTHTLVNGSITIQQGAQIINLKNTGANPASYVGNKANGTQVSTAVTLGIAQTKSFEDTGKAYKELTIVATTTTVEIEAIY